MNTLFLAFALLTFCLRLLAEEQNGSLNIAFCLSGQLARLELISKIRNIWIPNAIIGNKVDLFIYLDGNVTDVKQTYWRFDYSNNIYARLSSKHLKKFIEYQIYDSLINSYNESSKNIKIHEIRIEPPPQTKFSLRGNKIPVSDKTGYNIANMSMFSCFCLLVSFPLLFIFSSKVYSKATILLGPIDPFASPTSKEPAESRWQNNMRWMNGLRECVRWIQSVELRDDKFFDIIVRLRDDSYALKPWLFDPKIYRGHFVSTILGASLGFNDHDFTTDRQWADVLLRGAIEDYYFNQTLDKDYWFNPEHRFFSLAAAHLVPQLSSRFCAHPLIPLRGPFNLTHWRLHVAFAEHILDVCLGEKYIQDKQRKNKGIPQSRQPPQEKRFLLSSTDSTLGSSSISSIQYSLKELGSIIWKFYDKYLSPYHSKFNTNHDETQLDHSSINTKIMSTSSVTKSTESYKKVKTNSVTKATTKSSSKLVTKSNMKTSNNSKSSLGKQGHRKHLNHIGLRRIELDNPYTKEYLMELMIQNRDLFTLYQEFPQSVKRENRCCSNQMISAMKEQIVHIERVYDY